MNFFKRIIKTQFNPFFFLQFYYLVCKVEYLVKVYLHVKFDKILS